MNTSFQRHHFRSEARFLPGRGVKSPKVIFSRAAYSLICAFVELGNEEVGWLGSCYRQENGDFRVEEVFLVKQEVSPTQTELSTEGLSDLAMELVQKGEKGLDALNNLRFWGHSHVNMGCSPSGTDENTMLRSRHGGGGRNFCFDADGMPWAIRAIFNKRGETNFSIFLYEEGVRIDDAEWEVDAPLAVAAPVALPALPSTPLLALPARASTDELSLVAAGSPEAERLVTAMPAPESEDGNSGGLFRGGLFSSRRSSIDPRYRSDLTDAQLHMVRAEFASKVKSTYRSFSIFGRREEDHGDSPYAEGSSVPSWRTRRHGNDTPVEVDGEASGPGTTGNFGGVSGTGGSSKSSSGSGTLSHKPISTCDRWRLGTEGCGCTNCGAERARRASQRSSYQGPGVQDSPGLLGMLMEGLGKLFRD